MAFMKQQKWASRPKGGIYIPSGVKKSGETAESTIMGESITASTNTEKNNSGITALLCDCPFSAYVIQPYKDS